MIYTPTMFEKAQVYYGKHQDKPLAIIIPGRDDMGSQLYKIKRLIFEMLAKAGVNPTDSTNIYF